MSFFRRILGSDKAPRDPILDDPNRPLPLHVTDSDFKSVVLQADLPVIVDFWAEWCGPCHYIAPSVERLAAEFSGKAVIAKLNVDNDPVTPSTYGIMGIPTLIYFKGGVEVDRVVGVKSYQELTARLLPLLPLLPVPEPA